MVTTITNNIKNLAEFIDKSVYLAERNQSKIRWDYILKQPGQSSARIRHLLNNLGSLEGTGYLELGCGRGSTACAALYQNVSKGYLVDNFRFNNYQPDNYKETGWPEVKAALADNLKRSGCAERAVVIQSSADQIGMNSIKNLINLVYYDIYEQGSSYDNFKRVYPKLGKVFILVSNHTRREGIVEGIEKVLTEYTAKVHHTVILQSKHLEDNNSWWSGIKIWLVEKE